MRILRRRPKEAVGSTETANAAVPPWMQPLPTGPVVFDPSLRRAGELARQVPMTALEGRRPSEPAAVPDPPLHRRGHAA